MKYFGVSTDICELFHTNTKIREEYLITASEIKQFKRWLIISKLKSVFWTDVCFDSIPNFWTYFTIN